MKKSQISTIALIMIAMLTFQLAACAAKPSDSAIQKAVVETLAAAPTQPVTEVTKLVQVTQLVEVTAPVNVDTTSTPAATDTPSAADTDTATATQADTATQDATQLAVTPDTATPTALQPGTPLYWSLQYFVSRYNIMTDLQRQQFALALPGKTVAWYASLNNVTSDGSVTMKFPFGMQGSIILTDVPADTAVKINKGDQVEFTGMINSFDIVFNTLVISNVKVIRFYVEPTPTITPTPLPPTPTVYVSPN